MLGEMINDAFANALELELKVLDGLMLDTVEYGWKYDIDVALVSMSRADCMQTRQAEKLSKRILNSRE